MTIPTPNPRDGSRPGEEPAGGPPLLIIGHGSRTPEGTRQFLALTERVAARANGRVPRVVGGFLELAHPDVGEAVTGLGAFPAPSAGSPEVPRTVVAIPLMLSAAGHAKSDIPALLAAQQRRHQGLAWVYGRTLSPHPVLPDLLATRIDTALAGQPRAGTHVVLVGRGSSDPDANAEVAKVARLLWEGRGYDAVEVAFESVTGPTVPEALDRTARLGARRVVVAPYLLFPGVVSERIAAHVRAFAASRPDLDVRGAEVLGDCDELADLVLDRYDEALAGDLRMSCDPCTCRAPLPGVELPGVELPGVELPGVELPGVEEQVGHSRHGRGVVTLVGAGPGAADLITVRGARALAEADVVVSDRLVPTELLTSLRPEVDVVDVGKTPRRPSTYQEEINDLLIEQAQAGRKVVRLKGGDPFVFGRGHEEYAACTAAGVACEVVPGISSAIAAPELAGVPVTTRGVVHDLCIVTGHVPPGDPSSRTDWAALARLDGTLVIMMGIYHASKIAAVLIEHGRPGDTPVVVVENAATPRQRVLRGRLDGLGALMTSAQVQPPATVVVGAVAALADVGGQRPS
jgi:sirohydrochlorin cobaltochelatase